MFGMMSWVFSKIVTAESSPTQGGLGMPWTVLPLDLPMATAARATRRRAKHEAAVDGMVLNDRERNGAKRKEYAGVKLHDRQSSRL